ncbi:hypothetical protein J4772_31820 [Cohnella sp. LGH]|uniref:hypothetical protein n=1 Tax=Cohnella sp. LGH TaxID=1619153 RepID=UPI001ADCB4E9|nr:hypothetical protein [Cohnella sp. LGH]QTH42046.1 hypothetical protein J4772_31820 [Cohnella sp. LGH]
MKNKIIIKLGVIALILSLPLSAQASPKYNFNEIVYPSTETTINGVPESEIIRPMDVLAGPYFDSYTPDPSSQVRVPMFRQIASFSHDNTRNSQPFPMSVTITNSTSQGSEWTGSVSFTGEIKAGIFAKISATVGGSYKETRTTNEAVGMTAGPLSVPAYKTGYINVWYAAQKSGGTLRTYTYNTQNPSVRYYTNHQVITKVFKADYVDLHSQSWVQ